MQTATLVNVPGRGNAGPDHWQTLLERARPDTVRVRQSSWNMPIRRQWIAGLSRAAASASRPLLLIGHSIGAMTIVEWGLQHRASARVVGAILVAPPDLDRHLPGMPPRWLVRLCGWQKVPLTALPFPSVVVASTDDPFCRIARAEAFADAWGSRFLNLGACGHINTASGFGPFSQLEPLIQEMLQ